MVLSLGALARHRLESGDPAGAERELERALPVLRDEVAPHWLSAVLSTAGSLALEKGDSRRAEEYFAEALRCRAHQHADAARAVEGAGAGRRARPPRRAGVAAAGRGGADSRRRARGERLVAAACPAGA
ncbi:hypothetical protein IHE61_21780 [Streptomyces sp. GKU 257-1]|nr:hypothetical protein [Streptomyces sp. GKU 257-1]